MNYLFILKLECKKYFIGLTTEIQQDINKLSSSNWVKKYKPQEMLLFIEDCNDIDKYVILYMQKYGINNVRGGTYSDILLNSECIEKLKKIDYSTDKCYICGDNTHNVRECKKDDILCTCFYSYIYIHYSTSCKRYEQSFDNEDDLIEKLKYTIDEQIINIIKENNNIIILEPVNESPVNEPLVNEPLVNEPLVNEPLVNEPLVNEPLVNEPLVNEPLVNEPLVNEPLVNEPSVNEPSVNEPPVDELLITDPEYEKKLDELLLMLGNNNLYSEMPTLENVLYTPPSNIINSTKSTFKNRIPSYLKMNNKCLRCGRTSHKTFVCHAIKHIDGHYL
jgi:hypothetical protein